MSSAFLGKVIDNYRIIENLGVGGMGVVYKAIHIKLDKFFALKMIAPGLIMNENFIDRFQSEAKSLAKFEDPNIVQIYDLRSLDEQWFIVMEFVDGINLQEKIKNDGAFRWQDTLPVIRQILSAIGHAHSSGIVHRDIKPSNVMLSKEGEVKVTDFGLAKDESSFTSTMTIASGGTLYYMSPEHIKGFSYTDKRSDIYSIGMTFYEMLTGTVPFKEITSDFELRETIVRKAYPPPSSFNKKIPKSLETIVLKAVAKDTNQRYQSAEDMLQAIQEFEEETLKKSPDSGISQKKGKAKKSTQKTTLQFPKNIGKKVNFLRAALGVIATIVIVFLLYLAYPNSPPEQVIEEPVVTNGLLTILSDPPEATVYLNGDSIGTTPLPNLSVAVGTHSLTLTKEDYNSRDTTLIMQAGNHHDLYMNLNELVKVISDTQVQIMTMAEEREFTESTILVKSFPTSAILWINSQLQGQTPAKVRGLPPDNYLIKVEKEGYQIYDTTINLKENTQKNIFAELVSKTGGVQITTEPSGARVLLNGRQIENQQTPLSLNDIPVGKHQLEIIKPGYFSVEEEFEIQPGQTKEINSSLYQKRGTLSVRVKPWGSIYLNQELLKASTDVKYITDLPSGTYDLEIIHPTLGKWKKSLEIKTDKVSEVNINFSSELSIKVNAVDDLGTPIEAKIIVDGQENGMSTPAELRLRPGIHRISVKKPGYFVENGDQEFLVEAGFEMDQSFILKKIR